MSACTDTFGLNNSPLFERIRSGLPGDKTKSLNLIDVKDDLMFVWDSQDSCVLSLNWRAAKTNGFENIKFQTLLLSRTQNFQVDKILCSPEGSLIALAGNRGLTILELPRRWGPNGQFQEGKERIMCKSYNVDERLFINDSNLELLQIRWHPASPTDSHILVLLSDNSIRVYDESTLRHVWRVGPIPSVMHPAGTNVPFLNSLGETAVDFDIAPPRVVSCKKDEDVKDSKINNSVTQNTSVSDSTTKSSEKNSDSKIEWPLILLRGNGNIYILCTGIDSDKTHLEGPLTMVPPVYTNYGVDSCSVLVIPSLPPTVVIAESTGKLHHALLLEAEHTEQSHNEIDSSLLMHPCEWTLNVLETVELELGLSENKNTKSHTCPIHLKRDLINELRYFAYHNTGLHVVTINFVRQLRNFVESKDTANTLSLTATSNAEYLVCTKALDRNKVNAVLGFVLLHMPSGIVLLLSSGQVVSLNLIIDANFLNLDTEPGQHKQPAFDSPLQKIMKESFVNHIRNILKKDGVTQPILALDKTVEPTLDEAFELLQQATSVLREHYFPKHVKARNEIIKRVNVLKVMKDQQQREIQRLEHEGEKIRENAERLAEKFDEIYDKQQDILTKSENLVRLSNNFIPNQGLNDEEFPNDIRKIHESTKKLLKAIDQAKTKIQTQQLHINTYQKTVDNKKIDLPQKQENTIKEIILQITTEIDNQIQEIKKINSVINL